MTRDIDSVQGLAGLFTMTRDIDSVQGLASLFTMNRDLYIVFMGLLVLNLITRHRTTTMIADVPGRFPTLRHVRHPLQRTSGLSPRSSEVCGPHRGLTGCNSALRDRPSSIR